MGRRTQLGRADLLKCLHACGEGRLEGMAAALGYGLEPPSETPENKGKDSSEAESASPSADHLPQSTAAVATPRVCFYRLVKQRRLEPEEVVSDEPPWFRRAEAFRDEDEISAVPGASPPPQDLLMRWSRLWPFLKTALSRQQARRMLDIPLIVGRLARGKTLRHLPRKQRQSWTAECQLIIDHAESLLPFWTDFNQLYQRLRGLRGQEGLRLFALPDGDPGGRCWLPVGRRRWREIDRLPSPDPGAAVLILSDLGCLDKTDMRRRQWRRLGVRLQRAGCQPVVLSPCPPRWWDSELIRLFHPVCWDRAEHPPRRIGARRAMPPAVERGESDPGAERLLALLAPAIRIEPALLRAVRYLLPARECDVGSEAAAWNHPRVHPTPLAFYYDREAIADYRNQFLQDQYKDLRPQIAELIIRHHAHLSPRIGFEERLLLAELEGAADLEAQQDLERLVKTLQTADSPLADSGRAYVLRMTQRQHETMWQYDVLAAAWGAAHLPQLLVGEKLSFPAGLELGRISWLLARGQAAKRYTLRQRGQALYLEVDTPAAAASGLEASGSPVADVSATAPHVQLQRIAVEGRPRDEPIQRIDQAIALAPDERLHLRTDHQELTIDSIAKPAWAEVIGRDEQGLFVVWQSGQRRARWVNPGSYPVRNRSGDRLGQLTMADGYWRDEAEALAQQREGFPQPDWAEGYGLDDYGLYADVRIQGVVQRLRWIAPGEFRMGSPETEAERSDSETPHPVILTPGYWLADTACTQALWQAVMGNNPSDFKGKDRPVENVTWDDVQRFIEKLNSLVPNGDFRLPTEAEWEYACRAGTTTPFWFGDQITPEQVNYPGDYPYAGGQKGLYRGETVAVKALPCNDWGLYQMHGNVWEWCQDWYVDYPVDTIVDPTGPAEGRERVLRGGCWILVGGSARSAGRGALVPAYRLDSVGFRLARGQAVRSTGAGGEERERRQPRRTDAAEQVGQARHDAPASQDRKARKKKS